MIIQPLKCFELKQDLPGMHLPRRLTRTGTKVSAKTTISRVLSFEQRDKNKASQWSQSTPHEWYITTYRLPWAKLEEWLIDKFEGNFEEKVSPIKNAGDRASFLI